MVYNSQWWRSFSVRLEWWQFRKYKTGIAKAMSSFRSVVKWMMQRVQHRAFPNETYEQTHFCMACVIFRAASSQARQSSWAGTVVRMSVTMQMRSHRRGKTRSQVACQGHLFLSPTLELLCQDTQAKHLTVVKRRFTGLWCKVWKVSGSCWSIFIWRELRTRRSLPLSTFHTWQN